MKEILVRENNRSTWVVRHGVEGLEELHGNGATQFINREEFKIVKTVATRQYENGRQVRDRHVLGRVTDEKYAEMVASIEVYNARVRRQNAERAAGTYRDCFGDLA